MKEKIEKLKKERNAIILAHNYQVPEVQDIADFVGDSLELSLKAKNTDAKIIVFCGVHFMAETAKILCPNKIVLLPDINSGCPMADMIDAKNLKELKEKYPSAKVVCYVNTTAEVKAYSDICCTSANAVKVVNSISADEIIFIPDKYLGSYVSNFTNKKIILYNGYCPTHLKILPENILKLKEQYPNAKVVVHPECSQEVIRIADEIRSTTGICRFAKETSAKEIIVGTEIGILHRLKKENPEKIFYPAQDVAICPNMKLNTIEKVIFALEELKYQIEVKEEIAEFARKAIEDMIKIV